MANKITYPEQSDNSILQPEDFNQIKPAVNSIIDELEDVSADVVIADSKATNALNGLAAKVDKNGTDRLITAAEGTKLAGIAPNATAYTDAMAVSANASIIAGKVDKENGKGLSTNDYTTAEKTKLSGIATAATANSTDATLLNRANHTGTQLANTISDFASSILATVLTGINIGTSAVISAADTVLTALGKLQAQITANTTAINNLGLYASTKVYPNVDNNTTLATAVDVTGMTFPGKAGKTYHLFGQLHIGSDAGGSKMTIAGPGGQIFVVLDGRTTSGTVIRTDVILTQGTLGGGAIYNNVTGGSTAGAIKFDGDILCTVDGDIKVQFASATAGQTTFVYALGSYMNVELKN